jgi:hypothetical protein
MKNHMGVSMQDNAMAHTTNNSMNVLADGLWLAHSPSLKDKLYVLILIHYVNWKKKKIFGRKFQLFQDNNFAVV